jgi:hypothetical protein
MPDTWNKPRLDTRDFSTPIYPTAPQQSEASTSQTSNTGATAVGATNFVDQASNNFNQPHINQTNIEGRNIASAANAASLADIANKRQPIDARDSSTPIHPTAPSYSENPVNQPKNDAVKGAVASPEVAAPVLSDPLTNGLKLTANEFLTGSFSPEEMQAIDEIIIDDTIDFTYKNAVDQLISIYKLNPKIEFKITSAMLNKQSVKHLIRVLGKLPAIAYMNISGDFDINAKFLISSSIEKLEINGNATIEYSEKFDHHISYNGWKHIKELNVSGTLTVSEYFLTDINTHMDHVTCGGKVIYNYLHYNKSYRSDKPTSFVYLLDRDTKVKHQYCGTNTAMELQIFLEGCDENILKVLETDAAPFSSDRLLNGLACTIDKARKNGEEELLIISTKIYANLLQAFMTELLNVKKQGSDKFKKKFYLTRDIANKGPFEFSNHWGVPESIDTSIKFSAGDIKKLSSHGLFSGEKAHFNYYCDAISKSFAPIASKILDVADKIGIESDSMIRTVAKGISEAFKYSSNNNYLYMLTDPKIFNQTDKSWM